MKLWEHPNDSESPSRCFAQRQGKYVNEKFHDMRVGEDRLISESSVAVHVVIRVE